DRGGPGGHAGDDGSGSSDVRSPGGSVRLSDHPDRRRHVAGTATGAAPVWSRARDFWQPIVAVGAVCFDHAGRASTGRRHRGSTGGGRSRGRGAVSAHPYPAMDLLTGADGVIWGIVRWVFGIVFRDVILEHVWQLVVAAGVALTMLVATMLWSI